GVWRRCRAPHRSRAPDRGVSALLGAESQGLVQLRGRSGRARGPRPHGRSLTDPSCRCHRAAAADRAWGERRARARRTIAPHGGSLTRPGQARALRADPGHGPFARLLAHHLKVLRETEAFFADCLGGRAARFDLLEWAARLSGRLPLLDPSSEETR